MNKLVGQAGSLVGAAVTAVLNFIVDLGMKAWKRVKNKKADEKKTDEAQENAENHDDTSGNFGGQH